MKVKIQIVGIILIFCLTTSLQCEKECKLSESRFDTSKSWLPLKGKTQLPFLDNAGNLTNFSLQVMDTVREWVNPDCSATMISEYIGVALLLNPPDRDVIAFSFNPPNFLVVTGANSNNPNFYISDVFKKAKEGNVAKRLIGRRIF
ncbi:MAG: hypothetical protein WKF85_05420 [Chitinophagaceae bacterium]